jgi:hypothetical protein
MKQHQQLTGQRSANRIARSFNLSIYSDWIGTMVGFVDAQIHSRLTGYLLLQNSKEGSLAGQEGRFTVSG